MYDKSTEPNTEASDGSKHATDRQVILLFDICDVIYDEDILNMVVTQIWSFSFTLSLSACSESVIWMSEVFSVLLKLNSMNCKSYKVTVTESKTKIKVVPKVLSLAVWLHITFPFDFRT